MKIFSQALLVIFLLFSFTACLQNENESVVDKDVKHSKTAEDIEQEFQRQLKVYQEAEADPRQFKADLKENCPHFGNALLTTAETIQLGTRVFNAGGVSLTKRIYEGTIYKLLFTIKDDCMNLSDALQVGLAKAAETKRSS